MGNIKRLAKALLNPTKKMENILKILKKDYNIEPLSQVENSENHTHISIGDSLIQVRKAMEE